MALSIATKIVRETIVKNNLSKGSIATKHVRETLVRSQPVIGSKVTKHVREVLVKRDVSIGALATKIVREILVQGSISTEGYKVTKIVRELITKGFQGTTPSPPVPQKFVTSDNETQGRIPPLNTDFISMVQKEVPHFLEPIVTTVKKINKMIIAMNLSPRFHSIISFDSTAVADDVNAHIPIRIAGGTLVVYITLRQPITSDLDVHINCYSESFNGVLMSVTVPAATKPSAVITKRQAIKAKLDDLAVLTFDVKSGDGQTVPGIFTLTFEWIQ